MDNQEQTLLDQDGGVATLALNRPQKRNALSQQLRTEIVDRLKDLDEDESVQCVILTGIGSVFCAGFDRSELESEAMTRVFAESQEYHRRVYTFPKPLVAAINGPALGGGCDLAALCDVRIATESASFGQPQVRFGAAAAYDLMREILPEGAAREMCLTGRTYSAREALQLGLVTGVYEPDALMQNAREIAEAIASLPDPMARTAKQQFVASQPVLFQP
jgi:enoyl-CoA hydratase